MKITAYAPIPTELMVKYNPKVFSVGKRTLAVRLGMGLASKVHGVGMVLAYILHVLLFYAGYISTLTFLLMLVPAPIGIRQVIFKFFYFCC